MSDNLLRIGTSAILASTALLSTTSNNIANLNTPGHSRQRTEFESNMLGLIACQAHQALLLKKIVQKRSKIGYLVVASFVLPAKVIFFFW